MLESTNYRYDKDFARASPHHLRSREKHVGWNVDSWKVLSGLSKYGMRKLQIISRQAWICVVRVRDLPVYTKCCIHWKSLTLTTQIPSLYTVLSLKVKPGKTLVPVPQLEGRRFLPTTSFKLSTVFSFTQRTSFWGSSRLCGVIASNIKTKIYRKITFLSRDDMASKMSKRSL